MALKITRSTDPIEIKTITMCLYARPGIGRTSTGFTAADPILFDFDRAAYRSKFRRTTIHPDSWEDVVGMKDEDFAPFKTVVVDTVGRALDMLSVKLIKDSPKNGNGAGGLSRNGYGILKTTFIGWMNRLRQLGLDIVLLSHCEEDKDGDEIVERLDIQGGSKNEVYKVSDAMGRIRMKNGRKVLDFSPSETAFGKNPGQFPPIDVPDFSKEPEFLAGIIAQTKVKLNELSEEQRAVQALLEEWRAKIEAAQTPADFDALRLEAKDSDLRIKPALSGIMGQAAKALGIIFDKGTGSFVGPKEETAPSPKDTAPAAEPNTPAAGAKSAGGATSSRAKGKAKQQEIIEREPGSDDA